MTKYDLSPSSRWDLREIGRYTVRTWGPDKTIQYLQSIYMRLAQLAEAPQLGRPCPDIHPTARRYEHEKHVIFYREKSGGIRVLRILHQRQLPRRHVMEDK